MPSFPLPPKPRPYPVGKLSSFPCATGGTDRRPKHAGRTDGQADRSSAPSLLFLHAMQRERREGGRSCLPPSPIAVAVGPPLLGSVVVSHCLLARHTPTGQSPPPPPTTTTLLALPIVSSPLLSSPMTGGVALIDRRRRRRRRRREPLRKRAGKSVVVTADGWMVLQKLA